MNADKIIKTDEEIVSWLNQHTFFESDYDITI